MIARLSTKLVRVEGGKARDSGVECFSLSRRRRPERKTLSDVMQALALKAETEPQGRRVWARGLANGPSGPSLSLRWAGVIACSSRKPC
jgi:hypothetical protein